MVLKSVISPVIRIDFDWIRHSNLEGMTACGCLAVLPAVRPNANFRPVYMFVLDIPARFRDAARVLAKPLPNRSEEDDELDLAIMRSLTQGENALGDMEAARKVALHYPEEDRELMAKRIRDQWQRCGRL